MKFSTACIVTEDVARLRDFYSEILRIECDKSDPNPVYLEFELGESSSTKLAIYSIIHEAQLSPELSKAKTNRNLWLEFQVDDVETEYERLILMNVEFIEPPNVRPWGSKSFYFRDPDGNPISFFQPKGNV